jgi:hypothetical protein
MFCDSATRPVMRSQLRAEQAALNKQAFGCRRKRQKRRDGQLHALDP